MDDAAGKEAALLRLHSLLLGLPNDIPTGTTCYNFTNFALNQDDIGDYGEEGALNHALEIAFCPGGRQTGPVVFTEQGSGLVAVVETLRGFMSKFPENAILQKWVTDLTHAAEHAGAVPCDPTNEPDVSDVEIIPSGHDQPAKKIKTQRKRSTKKQPDVHAGSIMHLYKDITVRAKKGPGGRPPDDLLDELTVRTQVRNPVKDQNPIRFRCAFMPDGCDWSCADPRKRGVVYKHSAECSFLPSDLRQKVNAGLAALALAKKLKENGHPAVASHHAPGLPSPAVPTPPPAASSTVSSSSRPITSTPSAPATSTPGPALVLKEPRTHDEAANAVYQVSKKARRDKQKNALDYLIMRFVVVGGIPISNLNKQEWKDIWVEAAPEYSPPGATVMEDTIIPREAAYVKELMIDHLKGQYNLTITFDGNSTRGKQSVYTVHVTDPERRVFLLEGDEKSAISHTQERIYEVLKKVINLIGPDRFRAVSSDSTGNTAGARKLLLKEWTWMIELPDCCHRLSLLAKDLCKIPFLHEIIVDMSGVITHFQKSNQATAHLRLLRLAEGTGPGLTSAGKTRFVTQYFAGDALMRNLGHVEKLCLEGTVVLKEKGHLFATEASCGMFRYQLGRLLLVLAPIGKATTCLESSHSTVSDVMVFWLAVMLELHDIVVAKDNGLDTDVKELIRAAANKRWKQMFGTHDVYLTGLVLDPRYRGIDLGVKDLNPLTIAKVRIGGSASASGSQTSKVPELVKRAGNFLMDMAWTEYNVRERVIAGLSQEAVVERLRDQVLRFVKGAYPFDREVFPSDGPQQWWDRLNVDQTPSNPAQPLAWLCSAMFALCPNSIADERTGSTFTWMNSYLRNRLEVPTLVRMTQLRSWVRHKPSEPKPISRPTVKFRDMKASLGAVSTGTKRKRDHDGTANSDANVRDRDNSDSDSVRSDESSSSSDSEESDSDDDELDDAAGSGEFLAQRLVDFSQPTAALRDVLSSTAPPAPPARPVPKAPQPPSTSKPRLLKYSDWKM